VKNNHRSLNGRIPSIAELIYGILGLTFLQHRRLTRILQNNVYSILSILADRHPMYFPGAPFTLYGRLMHSKQVENALSRLGGVITVDAPRYKYMRFSEDELPCVKQNLEQWFSRKNRQIIKKLAREFYRELKKLNGR